MTTFLLLAIGAVCGVGGAFLGGRIRRRNSVSPHFGSLMAAMEVVDPDKYERFTYGSGLKVWRLKFPNGVMIEDNPEKSADVADLMVDGQVVHLNMRERHLLRLLFHRKALAMTENKLMEPVVRLLLEER